ncbi:MAG TPA: hydrogen peroxide-dependent heme synthase [Gemmatimonadaceae bacterium]|nr:hydrogen peroxide-dependent heme synthase [Gemmatimonadaceae bacterium]
MESPSLAPRALPPESLEGWYALHQIFSIDRDAVRARRNATVVASVPRVDSTRANGDANAEPATGGWTAVVPLIGSVADVMVLHFRSTLDELGQAQQSVDRLPVRSMLRPVYSFLSVTEAGLYHLTATLAAEAEQRGGSVGDEIYAAELAKRSAAERDSTMVQRRLYPPIPDGLPYVCFYPMNKRRDTGQNWYSLTLDERSQLMRAHGRTGRRYAGRVSQVITGAIGFDAWEWGVTLFGKDPLDFKKLVTDMRFDEVSAKYAEFGDFYVGKLAFGEPLESVVETIVG